MTRQISLEGLEQMGYKVAPKQSVSRPHPRKRNRIALFLTFPIVVFSWFIGWSLYWIGYKEKAVKPKKISVNEEPTTTVTMPEMEYVIQHKAST